MIIEEEDSDDDVEVDDEELDDMDRLATKVYTEGKQPSDEDMPYVDEEDRHYQEGLLSENEDLFDVHLPDMQPTSGNVNIQVRAGCTSNLLQLVGVTTNNVNMEIMVLKTGPGREPKMGVVPVLVVGPVVEPVTS